MSKEVLLNGNTIEVLETNFNLSTKTVNSGFSNQKTVLTFSGRLKKNKPTMVGTISLTTEQNSIGHTKRLVKKSKLDSINNMGLGSNLKLILKSTNKDTEGNITGHIYDVVFTAKETTSKSNKLTYSLVNNPRVIRNEHKLGVNKEDKGASFIESIQVGSKNISPSGAKYKIQLTGLPYTWFNLKIGEVASGEVETFITNPKLSKEGLLNAQLDSSGKYSFTQIFPSTTTDKRYDVHVQVLKPNNFSPVVPELSYDSVGFSKKLLSGTWRASIPGWEGWLTRSFTQKTKACQLTIRLTTTDSHAKINGVTVTPYDHDSDGGTANVQVHDKVFRGQRGLGSTTSYPIRYVLSGRTFTTKSGAGGASPFNIGGENTFGVPKFSNTTKVLSDWTNSVYTYNNGTLISINDISVSGSGTSDYTLSFVVFIESFGRTDTIMSLDLDSVVQIT